jgi:hypothetical protein
MFVSVFPAAAGTSIEEISVVEEKMKDNPFVKLQQHFSSYYKINKDTENSHKYINPVQFYLPWNSAGKECPFHYVLIVETVAAIVSDLDYTNLTRDQTPHGFLYDFKDGSTWKNSKYFQENPDALTGQLYSDAAELDNPLVASKGILSALNVYFSAP